MVGDLKLSIDDDNIRELGCTDLAIGKSFCVLLKDSMNRLHFALTNPLPWKQRMVS